ncbi:DUF3795 domain-containing protein [candidate division WOR-3 bacterium]|nr:DUF3795 domain-containing protein [candidate division WOR-3 bacterium]
MAKLYGVCGIECGECPAYRATQTDDNGLRAETAAEWSKAFGHPFKPEDINCDGCVTEGGRKIGYCGMCEIRKCGTGRGLKSCAFCPDYACERLTGFFKTAGAAKPNLDALRAGR